MRLREELSFGFEQTFTTPDWWADPGFVATSNTPLKLEKMELLAARIAEVLGGRSVQSEDIYRHLQYETFDARGAPSFVVTMDPGSIEVKTPPLKIAGMTEAMRPLFEAADLAGVVPYRNWWYGVRTGTEGGCHVNMAGLTPATNPLRRDPALVLKYAAFFHNRPCLHYPFAGVDVGPGGNAMRMDEHALDPHSRHAPGTLDSVARFEALRARVNAGERPTAEAVEAHFKGSKLAEDKHSAPSFYKFKAPLFFIEERGVESLRAAEEFALVSELRLRAFERGGDRIEALAPFDPELHRSRLGSRPLWREFEGVAAELGLDPAPYRPFFDRQFPRLEGGVAVPAGLELREGRRPRVITDVKMRGELLISKTVDTRHARLELRWPKGTELRLNGRRLPGQDHGVLIDYVKGDRPLEFELGSGERARFSPKDMMFQAPGPEAPAAGPPWPAGAYLDLSSEI